MIGRPCPECGTPTECDSVDNGIGEQQCGPYGCPACHWVEPSIDELISRSSIGAGLRDIKERGIDAHLVDLEREMHPRRKR